MATAKSINPRAAAAQAAELPADLAEHLEDTQSRAIQLQQLLHLVWAAIENPEEGVEFGPLLELADNLAERIAVSLDASDLRKLAAQGAQS